MVGRRCTTGTSDKRDRILGELMRDAYGTCLTLGYTGRRSQAFLSAVILSAISEGVPTVIVGGDEYVNVGTMFYILWLHQYNRLHSADAVSAN
jgi:hypothetical protein